MAQQAKVMVEVGKSTSWLVQYVDSANTWLTVKSKAFASHQDAVDFQTSLPASVTSKLTAHELTHWKEA